MFVHIWQDRGENRKGGSDPVVVAAEVMGGTVVWQGSKGTGGGVGGWAWWGVVVLWKWNGRAGIVVRAQTVMPGVIGMDVDKVALMWKVIRSGMG